MRSIDYNGRVLCKLQGNLFACYKEFCPCSPLVFVRRFMNSELSKRFDNLLVLTEASSVYTLVDELDEEYGKTKHGNPNLFSSEVLYWAGYLLRYWCFTYEIPSNVLIHKINLNKIFERYYIYHSMDPYYAIERIIEEDNIVIKTEEKDIIQIIENLKKDF